MKFDTSDYSKDNVFNLPCINKKVIGLMKDENHGRIMTEFIGLRSKRYTYKVLNNEITEEVNKKAKGITERSLKTINFDDYYKCLFSNILVNRGQ